jgi:hypothetical protein
MNGRDDSVTEPYQDVGDRWSDGPRTTDGQIGIGQIGITRSADSPASPWPCSRGLLAGHADGASFVSVARLPRWRTSEATTAPRTNISADHSNEVV